MNRNFVWKNQPETRVYKVKRPGSTFTPDINNYDRFELESLAAALIIQAPSGTPTDFQSIIISMKDNGTARALTLSAIYKASGTALPTTTTLGKFLTLEFMWRSYDQKWHLLSSALEA